MMQPNGKPDYKPVGAPPNCGSSVQKPIDKLTTLEQKLEYLDRLTRMFVTVKFNGIHLDIADRMEKVCDSIEKDLGLGADVEELDVTLKGSEPETVTVPKGIHCKYCYASIGQPHLLNCKTLEWRIGQQPDE